MFPRVQNPIAARVVSAAFATALVLIAFLWWMCADSNAQYREIDNYTIEELTQAKHNYWNLSEAPRDAIVILKSGKLLHVVTPHKLTRECGRRGPVHIREGLEVNKRMWMTQLKEVVYPSEKERHGELQRRCRAGIGSIS